MPAQDSARSDEQPHPGQAPSRHRPGEQRQPRPSRARAFGRSRSATANWWRSIKISASFRHDSRRGNLSGDMTPDTTRKTSFKPTSRRSSHLRLNTTGRTDAERLTELFPFP